MQVRQKWFSWREKVCQSRPIFMGRFSSSDMWNYILRDKTTE
ncbi:hypothetical protein LINGRAHAP2_LOCUS32192, partial [Linum grandiflorum]